MLLFPHFSDFPVSLFLPPLTLSPQFYLCVSAAVCFFLPAHSKPFSLLVALSSLSLALSLTASLSIFFLIRVTHHCCTDCANVTTQSDITDNNKLFPKIPTDTVVLLLRSPINLAACGYSLYAVFVIFPVYACVCNGEAAFASKQRQLVYRPEKRLYCCHIAGKL